MAASNAPSAKGRADALARTFRAPGCWSSMTREGSTATTSASAGSYEPVPAPTLTTVRAPPRPSRISAASRGSGCRTRR